MVRIENNVHFLDRIPKSHEKTNLFSRGCGLKPKYNYSRSLISAYMSHSKRLAPNLEISQFVPQ